MRIRVRLGGIAVVGVMLSFGAMGSEGAMVEYLQRMRATDLGDAGALMDLADWAERRNLTEQAGEHYRGILELEPEHPHAYERLSYLADTGQLARDEEREVELERRFGAPFELHVSPHFLVIYDTDKGWALNRAVLLEKTHDLYYQSMRKAGLRPLPLRERLVCVLFDDYEMFRRYGEVIDRLRMEWSSGYYSSGTNRIAFFNDKTSPMFDETTGKIAALEVSTEALKEELRDPRVMRNGALVAEARRKLGGDMRDLNWHRNRLKSMAAMNNASKTTHEALHQLAFNSGLLTMGVRYPFWVVEGMAMNYEVEDGAKGFGPYYVNQSRRKQLIEHTMAQRLIGLGEFVSLVRAPAEEGERVAVMYAQGWGLFQFLFKKRHQQMRAYLKGLGAAGREAKDGAGLLKEFEEAFGDMNRLEREWQGYLRLLRS